MHRNSKMKNPNLLDEIKKMERVEILIGIDQKLRDNQQIVTEMIRKNLDIIDVGKKATLKETA